jgi:PAS domain S-box-containing protein
MHETGAGYNPFGPDLLRQMVDTIPSMLAYWDSDCRCRFANRAYEQWFGVKAADVIGRTIQELLGPNLFALNEPFIRGALRGEKQSFERTIPTPGGGIRHSLAQYLPDVKDGEVRGFIALVTEITQLKAAQAALRDSEEKFRLLSESSPAGILQTDASGMCVYANAQWQEISGLTFDSSRDRGWVQALHADERDAVLSAWEKASEEGLGFELEFRVQRPDDSIRTISLRAQPLPAAHGQSNGVVSVLEDVTERREAERRLRASESFLERTGRIVAVGGWEFDIPTGRITWSEQTRRIHEVGPDYHPEMANAMLFYAPEARPAIEAAVQAAMRDGQSWDLELPFVTAKGRPIWVRTFGEVEYEAGAPVRLVGAFQDVTEHRTRRLEFQREKSLRVQSERHAQDLNRLLKERSEMLDVLAHEVRQPLNNASAALQSANSTLVEIGEKVASMRLTRAQSVMSRVLASIDNTLAVASLLARPDSVRTLDTDIDMLLEVTIADIPDDQRKRIVVERTTTTRTASMEMNLMRLALRNLLTNGLKYSPEGSMVTLRLTDSDDPLGLVIDVADSGPGIADAWVPHLFQRGVVETHATDRAAHGLGLGLYIVRRVMELHGGQAELARNGADGVTMRLMLKQ